MPPAKPPPSSTTKRPVGRPRREDPRPSVTGLRIPAELLERLDAILARRAAELARLGGSPSRNALIVAALAEFCDREEAAARAGAPSPAPPASGS